MHQLIVALLVMMSITIVRSAEIERSNVHQLRGSGRQVVEKVHNVNRERKELPDDYDDVYYYDDDGNENGAYDDDDEASLPEEDILQGYVDFYKKRHGEDEGNDR